MKSVILCTCLAIVLVGCAKEPEPVAIDTFCISAKKRTWSVNDTPETIRDVTAWNKLVDLRCGYPGKKV